MEAQNSVFEMTNRNKKQLFSVFVLISFVLMHAIMLIEKLISPENVVRILILADNVTRSTVAPDTTPSITTPPSIREYDELTL